MSEPAAPSVPSSPQSDISDPVAEINRLKKEMEEKTRQMEEKTRQMEEMKKRNAQLQQQIDANTSKQSSKASEVRTGQSLVSSMHVDFCCHFFFFSSISTDRFRDQCIHI
jgi:sucrose-6-phosphate hydrolase SacC (GH32 family)